MTPMTDAEQREGARRVGRPRRRVQAIGLVVVMAALLTAALWLATARLGGTIAINTASSGSLLAQLVDVAGLSASATGAASHRPADGTTPDTADRDFRVGNVAATRAALLAACSARALRPPDADTRRMLPEVICTGPWHGRDATVLLFPGTCGSACPITIEVRTI